MKYLTFAFLLIAFSALGAAPENIEVCAACHGDDGEGVGYTYVPIIAGTPAARRMPTNAAARRPPKSSFGSD